MIRHEHVQHLSRTNAVEQLYAEFFFPFLTKMSRQRFAGRDTQAQAGTIDFVPAAMMFEQQVVDHGDAEEDRGSMLAEDPGYDVGSRLFTTEDRGGSVEQWKREAVAQAVRKRQSR